jgi:hypothetical protein
VFEWIEVLPQLKRVFGFSTQVSGCAPPAFVMRRTGRDTFSDAQA